MVPQNYCMQKYGIKAQVKTRVAQNFGHLPIRKTYGWSKGVSQILSMNWNFVPLFIVGKLQIIRAWRFIEFYRSLKNGHKTLKREFELKWFFNWYQTSFVTSTHISDERKILCNCNFEFIHKYFPLMNLVA